MKYELSEKYFTGKEIRILFVENKESDFLKAQAEILKSVQPCIFRRVENIKDFSADIYSFKPDLIIMEFGIQNLSCKKILALVSKQELLMPLIIYTNECNEDKALECLYNGAKDYVIKEHSKRLGNAVVRVLNEKKTYLELLFSEKDLDQFKKYVDRYVRWEANVPALTYLQVLRPDNTQLFSYVSSASKRLFDLLPEEIVRDSELVRNLRHPDDIPDMEKALNHSAKTLEPFRYVSRFLIKREIRWYSFIAHPQKQLNGDIIWDGIMLDITEQKLIEQALSTKHSLMRTLMDNTPDVIYFKDIESRFINVNKGYLTKINAKSEEEILGKTDFDIFDFEHANDARNDELKIIKTGMPIINKIEKEILKSGKTQWVTTTKIPYKNNLGEIVGTFGISRDITEFMNIEEAFNAERNLLRTLIDALPDCIYVKDIDGKFILNNKAHLTELGVKAQEEAKEKTDFNFYKYSYAARYASDDLNVIESGRPMYYREEISNGESGKNSWHLVTKIPLLDQKGNVTGIVGISHDITESKTMEEQLRSSETRLRNIVIATSAVLYTMRVNGDRLTFTWVGDNINQFGFLPEDIVKSNFWNSVIHPDDTDYLNSKFSSLLKENKIVLEYRIKNKDGNYLWIRDESVLVRDTFGKPSEIFGSWLDINERMKVEHSLLNIESQLTTALKIAKLAYWEHDYIKNVFIFNDQFYSLFRTTAEKEGGYYMPPERYTSRFIHPDDNQIVAVGVQKAVESNDPNMIVHLEHRIFYADGEPGFISVRFNIVQDANGKIIGTRGANQDITERKRAEEALRASQAQLSNALEIAHLAHWEYDVLKKSFILNDQYYSLFHTTAEKEGGYLLSLENHIRQFVHPDDAEIIRSEIEKAIKTDDTNYTCSREHRIRYADGGYGYMSIQFNIQKDALGGTVKIHGTIQEITQQKLAEDALRASESLLRKSQSVARVGSFKYDFKSGKWESSQTLDHILGIDENYPRNLDGIKKLLHTPNTDYLNSILKAVRTAKGNRFERENVITRHNDGRQRWVQLISDIEFDKDKNPVIMIGTVQDITERVQRDKEKYELEKQLRLRNEELEKMLSDLKQMQSTLVQSEKMASMGQLSAGIAHEINNPLAYVSSNINRIKEYFKDTTELLSKWQTLKSVIAELPDINTKLKEIDDFAEQIDIDFILQDFDRMMISIQDGTQRIKKIIEGMRGFAHISDSSFTDANINQVIEDILTIVWNEIKYKATIEKRYEELPLVKCNIGEIKQVLVNLLINASQAINEKGTIGIETFVNDEHVIIKVKDTGCGISPENIKRIFDPFFTTKPVGTGTGLGLWISSSIIEKHSGTLTVESEPGLGSTFTIKLPIEQSKVKIVEGAAI